MSLKNLKTCWRDELHKFGKMIIYFLGLLVRYKIRGSKIRGRRITVCRG